MAAATLFTRIVDGLCRAGGLGDAAFLGLDAYGSRGYEPCPREAEYPGCAHPPQMNKLKESTCPAPCQRSSNCSPARPSR